MNSWFRLPKDKESVPQPRWGHSMCKFTKDFMIMFGGYADSLYFNDLWLFNVQSLKWKIIKLETETVPVPRSNASLVYNDKNQTIVIFGGGSSGSERFSDLWEFQMSHNFLSSLSGKWVKVQPTSAQVPWCRTYHVTQKYHNFMIIHGGEAFKHDLDDIWALDLNTYSWQEVQSQKGPESRRFHSSCLVGDYFYVIGGCEGNYNCFSDIQRLDLSFLREINEQKTAKKQWENLNYFQEEELNRWGHCSCSIGQSIYIFGGRNTSDYNELLTLRYDEVEKCFMLKKIETKEKPCGRRKATLLEMGSFLFLFGGFNQKYFNQVSLFNTFYTQELFHKQINNKISIEAENCDIHLATKDGHSIHLNTSLIDKAFPSVEARIEFLESLAQTNFQTASRCVDVLNEGFVRNKRMNNNLLEIFQIEWDENSLLGYKKRIRKNILGEHVEVNENPYYPVRVSSWEYLRISTLIKNNPHNNIIIKSCEGKKFNFDLNLLIVRSQYMKLRFSSNKYQKFSPMNYTFEVDKHTLMMMLIYFSYGHLIIPQNTCISQIITLYDAADMYCLQVLKQICLEEIKRVMFQQNNKKDLEIVVKKGIKEKQDKNWLLLQKFGVGMLSGLRRQTLKNIINRQIQNLRQKIVRKSQTFSVPWMIKEEPERREEYQQIQEMNKVTEKCKQNC